MKIDIKFNIGDMVYFIHPTSKEIKKGKLIYGIVSIYESGAYTHFTVRSNETNFTLPLKDCYGSFAEVEKALKPLKKPK